MTGSAQTTLVVDASVGVKLLLPEPETPTVQALVRTYLISPSTLSLIVPDLFFVECANVLWKTARRGALAPEKVHRACARLAGLGLGSYPTADLVAAAVGIALDHDIPAYDAYYVALAARTGATLVTADERLAARVAAGPATVVLLRDLRLPDPQSDPSLPA